ncbi:MAG TPA: response regulator [Tepidisphaeraceae bacterium]|nr:response regulator [Tepidisphaeraceae bacterium]
MRGLNDNFQEVDDVVADRAVLIVEDERTSRRALTALLEESGYRTQAVASAEEALEVLDGHSPDIALIDIDLPGMSGLELITRLEKLDPHVVPIVITASEGEKVARFALTHPVQFLRKPVDFERLLTMMDQAQDKH